MNTNASAAHSARELEAAFLHDHQHLTQGLYAIIQALEAHDVEAAVLAARQVDQTVGPHMAFEEEVFYPELKKTLGNEFVVRLYREHEAGREAVRALIANGTAEPLTDETQARLLADLNGTLEHALSCGSLLSYVARLQPTEHDRLLRELEELRLRGGRWTDMGEPLGDPE
jgi:hemerythrin-like domain-containing protein